MPAVTAASIRNFLQSSPPESLSAWRIQRRNWSRELKSRPAQQVIELGLELIDIHPWGRLTAYELIACHPSGIVTLTPQLLSRLGHGLNDWGSVDTFACYLAGPAWREGRLPTRHIHTWLRSPDRWKRRTAVVCTVALNVRARGGHGDVERTLDVCRRVVADRDDMVVKAVSWALRSLVEWDRAAVANFLKEHDAALAARIKREVSNKLRTGRKTSRRANARGRTHAS